MTTQQPYDLVGIGVGPGKLDRREALQLGGVLALGGEFAFVVFAEADRAGLLVRWREHKQRDVLAAWEASAPH